MASELMAVSLDSGAPVGFYYREKGVVRHDDLESVDLVVFSDGHDDGVGLADGVGNASSCRRRLAGQHLLPDRVYGLVLQLAADFFPADVFPDPCPGRVQAVSRRHGEDGGVAVNTGPIRRGRLVEEPLRLRAGFSGLRFGLRTEHGKVEFAVIADIAGFFR